LTTDPARGGSNTKRVESLNEPIGDTFISSDRFFGIGPNFAVE